MLFSNTVEGQTNCSCETSSEYPLQLLQLVLILIIFFLLSILFCVLLTDYLRADSDEAPVDDGDVATDAELVASLRGFWNHCS